jgi:integrase
LLEKEKLAYSNFRYENLIGTKKEDFMKADLITIEQTEIYSPPHVEARRYTNSFTEQDMSKNSIGAYLSDWEDFCMWCQQNNCQFMPANSCDVADYLEDRAKNTWVGLSGKNRSLKEKQPLKWNSLERRLTAIAKIHQYNGYEFSRKDPAIKRTLAGIKRVLSKEQTHRIIEERKSPVLMEDIRKMVDSLPESLSGKRDRALLLIGFSGALRRSELAGIHKEHLQFLKEGIILLLPWSKTGMREVNIPYGSNPNTCPVRALQEWITIAKIESGPVFRAVNRHRQIQNSALSDKAIALIITRNDYIKDKVKEATEKKAHDSTIVVPDFGGHSLRAGFVTQAILNEAPEHAIMAHTGHKKSDTLKKYIREVNRWKHNAAARLGL